MRIVATGTALVLFASTVFAGVRNGDSFNIPKSAAGGATTVKVVVKKKSVTGDLDVHVKSGNGTSPTTSGTRTNAGSVEVSDTKDDMTVESKDPETGEITTHNTYRVKNGKFQYKGKDGKWHTRRRGGEQGKATGSAAQEAS